MTDHASARLEILPVEGLPEFRPGDDLTGAIAVAARWLRSGDVVVVTSKIVSKAEGRLIRVPSDPEERDAARRKLVEDEAIRVIARIGRTVITQNRIGIVQAASGVDASNVSTDEVALLPTDPDASALALRNGYSALNTSSTFAVTLRASELMSGFDSSGSENASWMNTSLRCRTEKSVVASYRPARISDIRSSSVRSGVQERPRLSVETRSGSVSIPDTVNPARALRMICSWV